MDLQNTTLTQLRQLLDSKSISAAELTDAYLERIRAVDGSLLSYITVTPEEAHAQAEQAQTRIDAGNAAPLTGIPMAMKDNLCTDGAPPVPPGCWRISCPPMTQRLWKS